MKINKVYVEAVFAIPHHAEGEITIDGKQYTWTCMTDGDEVFDLELEPFDEDYPKPPSPYCNWETEGMRWMKEMKELEESRRVFTECELKLIEGQIDLGCCDNVQIS